MFYKGWNVSNGEGAILVIGHWTRVTHVTDVDVVQII